MDRVKSLKKHLYILGTRGVPAQHGGFETFAEKLSLYLISHGWDVSVYCQEEGAGGSWESNWLGVKRIHVPVRRQGASGTIIFDWLCIWDSCSRDGLFLTLGYNTACFNVLQRLKGKTNVINMDGIEWRREKWGAVAKTWFWLNERIGCWVGNHLVADHPKIKSHLSSRVRPDKITMIPYGGDNVLSADASELERFGLEPGRFSVIIARPEPENSFLEMVRAFSAKKRNHHLLVLGNFDHSNNPYHQLVMSSAGDEVVFPGAIYDGATVRALRFFCRFYLHGHQVGGTNPSLVEALGAGCAVIAHDNHFNQWVAGSAAEYFSTEAECEVLFERLLSDDAILKRMRLNARRQFNERFTWEQILLQYELLLEHWYPASVPRE